MTRRGIVVLLGVPLALAAAWTVGGVAFDHPPPALGGVVVVDPAADRTSVPSGAPSIDPPNRPAPPPPTPAATTPAPAADPAAPGGATPVPPGAAFTAGDDDDDTDDGGADPDDDGVDDDTDS